ncbi:MAG TPA: glyoxalase [Clostridia bacterium]|nr:glyoxalase [Clostridia bacterium]
MFEEIHEMGWNTAEFEYPSGRVINFQIETDELYEIKLRLEKADIPLFKDIKVNKYNNGNEIYTERELLVQDPDRYLLRFSTSEPDSNLLD